MTTTKAQALETVATLGEAWEASNRKDDAVRDELIAAVRAAVALWVPEYTVQKAARVSRTTISKWTA